MPRILDNQVDASADCVEEISLVALTTPVDGRIEELLMRVADVRAVESKVPVAILDLSDGIESPCGSCSEAESSFLAA